MATEHVPQQVSDAFPKRLVLCFDGTGNQFNANETDSNIVKLYEMFNRNTPDQYHYYQPGIGTYENGKLTNVANQGFFARLRSSFAENTDMMFGTSFVDHVIGGYEFLLRYFAPGDKIYIFGFSRGAYTARFLSEMIDNIGLLSRGNNVMIRFAWDTFSAYQRLGGKDSGDTTDANGNTNTANGDHSQAQPVTDDNALYSHGAGRPSGVKPKTKPEAKAYMDIFRSTFCRPDVQVHFLGLFESVNSVAQFDISKNSTPYIPRAPARHIRHALSIHERRANFRPSLFLLDPTSKDFGNAETIEEVWFAGNHGDVGGGWGLMNKDDQFLVSDIPLKWMVDEVRSLDETEPHKIAWQEEKVKWLGNHVHDQINSWTKGAGDVEFAKKRLHDTLSYECMEFKSYQVTGWRFLETLPFSRWESIKSKAAPDGNWVFKWFPPNYGAIRDIPHGAHFHDSVQHMIECEPKILQGVPEPKGEITANWLSRYFQFLFLRETRNQKMRHIDPKMFVKDAVVKP